MATENLIGVEVRKTDDGEYFVVEHRVTGRWHRDVNEAVGVAHRAWMRSEYKDAPSGERVFAIGRT